MNIKTRTASLTFPIYSEQLEISNRNFSVYNLVTEHIQVHFQTRISVISCIKIIIYSCVLMLFCVAVIYYLYYQKPTETSKQPIRTGHLGHVTGY
eukprot:sb/3479265/